ILLLQAVWQQYQQVEPIPYSQFQSYLKDGKVDDIVISDKYVQGKLKNAGPDQPSEFITTRVDPNTAAELEKYGVKFRGATESGLGALVRDILSWVLPVVIFFGLWMFVFRKIAEKQGFGGGFMTVGKSKAKIYVETDTKVTFADVAGVDEAKAELQEIVQ